MNRTKILWLFIIVLLSATVKYASGFTNETVRRDEFKVIGYYSGDLFNEPLEKLQTDKLTHVMYAFLIPKNDGTLVDLKMPDQLSELVAKAHKDGCKVFISLGGWSYEGNYLGTVFEELASNEETRKIFIDNVCAFTEEYNLDGVELDWEHPNSSTIGDYEKLVVELNESLKLKGKELSAALTGAWSPINGYDTSKVITKTCLNNFSFINIMAYDLNEDDHSPIWFAESCISYWLLRGVPSEKVVLGMPLYAKPSWMQYRHLVAKNSEYAYLDYVPTSPLESHYNGMNTLREKTVIALKRAGGVMLFDVNEDTNDETSIVSMIDNLVTKIGHMSKNDLNKYITVVLNNRELEFSEEEGLGIPFINLNNRIMIPMRKSLESIGATVSYDGNNRIVTAVKEGITIKVSVGGNVLKVNEQDVIMDTHSIIKDSRIYIPLQAVFKAFNYDVQWHSNSKTVILTSN